ncbi:MAG: hypothetical protein ABJL67_23565 [Sulfitobacter sp.]
MHIFETPSVALCTSGKRELTFDPKVCLSHRLFLGLGCGSTSFCGHTSEPAPMDVAEAARWDAEQLMSLIGVPTYNQVRVNEWVWNISDDYTVVLTKSLGGDQDWSFRVNNSGRCFIASMEEAKAMAFDALREEIECDVNTANALNRRLRALATREGE